MALTVIILAAGKGTRMNSRYPKVLQPLAGRPLLAHVLEQAQRLEAARVITVYGHGGEQVQQAFAGQSIDWVEQAEQLGTAMITIDLADPTGYGRIKRDNGKIISIVEHKDASDTERQITEVNTGIYCVDNALLHRWLPNLSNDNVQGEYYLTDMVAMAAEEGLTIGSIAPALDFEIEGVNDRIQLASLERRYEA